MARKPSAKKLADLIDKRIERAYARCSGVQIDIMDISKVFNAGRAAIVADPAITDAALGDAVVAFVDTIRKN